VKLRTMVWSDWGAQKVTRQLPSPQTGAATASSSVWGVGSCVHKTPGNIGMKCQVQECSNFSSFKYIFSPLLVIKVQGQDASFLLDICFDS